MKTRFAVPVGLVLVSVVSTHAAYADLVAAPILIDNGGSGYSTAAWTEQSGVVDAFNSNQGYNSLANNTGASATHTFSGLISGADYRVFTTWRQGGQGNVTTAAPYTISDGGTGGTLDQRATSGPPRHYVTRDTNGAGTLNFEFQYLDTVTEGGDGTITYTITGPSTGGYSLSDAVVVAPVVPGLHVIDNGETGYSQTGFTNQASSDSFNSNQAYNSSSDNGGVATWDFSGLRPGIYEVFASWDADGQANLSTVAPYTISDGGGLVTVNQELGPTMDLIVMDTDGANVPYFNFEKLTEALVTDGQLQVRLDAVAGGGAGDFVFADAIALNLAATVPEPSAFALGLLAAVGLASVMCRSRRRRG